MKFIHSIFPVAASLASLMGSVPCVIAAPKKPIKNPQISRPQNQIPSQRGILSTPPEARKVQITSHNPGDRIGNRITVTGTAMPTTNIKVRVMLDGPEKVSIESLRVKSDAGGNWSVGPITLWAYEGTRNPEFLITAEKANDSHDKQEVRVSLQEKRPINRRPGAPRIAELIDQSRELGRPAYILEGTAGNNRTVEITVSASYKDKSNRTQTLKSQQLSLRSAANGKWKTPLILLPTTLETDSYITYKFSAKQVSGTDVSPSTAMEKNLFMNRRIPPVITSPVDDAKVSLGGSMRIEGKAIPHSTVRVKIVVTWTRYPSLSERLFTGKKNLTEEYPIHIADVDANGRWRTGYISLKKRDPNVYGFNYTIEAVQEIKGQRSTPHIVKIYSVANKDVSIIG